METSSQNSRPESQFDAESFIGKEIGNITLVSLLGRGAMGGVFVGYQKSLKRKVAVKIYPRKSPESGKMRFRFRDEAEIVAVLNHPNIVPVFDMGETDEALYIIMQLIEGEDLRSLLRKYQLHPVPAKKIIPLQSCLQIMIRILDALSYAHTEGVIHRDIKPANILFDERNNRPFLADFGIASGTITHEAQADTILGTPLYIAPEQVWGKEIDNRADLYSAGIVLFELITGKLPMNKMSLEEVLKIKMYDPDSLFTCTPSAASKQIDRNLEKIILNAIAPDPDSRYFNCKKFHDELVTYSEGVFPELRV